MRWFTFFLLAIAACGNDFTPYQEIDAPRVLALRASLPEIQFGETATLDALTTEAPTSYAWSWCPFAAGSSGAYACLVDAPQVSEIAGIAVDFDLGTNATADLHDIAPPDVLERLCAAFLTIDLPSDTAQPACDGGIDVRVRLVVRWGELEIVAFKDVRWSWLPLEDATRNGNPPVPRLVLRRDGVDASLDGSVTVPHDTEVEFVAVLTDESERLAISWFITAGELDPPRESFIPGERDLADASDVTWTSPLKNSFREGTVDVYAVVRDDRGGVAWSRGAVGVAP